MVVLITLSKVNRSAFRTAAILSRTRRVCAAMSPGTIWPELGSSGIWPLQNRNLPLRTACELGPIAAGDSLVEMIFFIDGIVTYVEQASCLLLRAQGSGSRQPWNH